jgi:hypothetical protein
MPSDRQILQERVAWGVRIHHIFTSNVYMLQKKNKVHAIKQTPAVIHSSNIGKVIRRSNACVHAKQYTSLPLKQYNVV